LIISESAYINDALFRLKCLRQNIKTVSLSYVIASVAKQSQTS